jgi:hypothetical protein
MAGNCLMVNRGRAMPTGHRGYWNVPGRREPSGAGGYKTAAHEPGQGRAMTAAFGVRSNRGGALFGVG